MGAETNVVGEAGVLGVTVRTVGRDEKKVTRERAAVAQKECRNLVVRASGSTPSGLVVKVLASGSTLETSGLVVKVLASGSTLESGLVVKVQASGNILEPSGLVKVILKVRASGNILEASGLVKAKIQASGILEPSGLVKAKAQASGSILEPSGLVKAKVLESGLMVDQSGFLVVPNGLPDPVDQSGDQNGLLVDRTGLLVNGVRLGQDGVREDLGAVGQVQVIAPSVQLDLVGSEAKMRVKSRLSLRRQKKMHLLVMMQKKMIVTSLPVMMQKKRIVTS